MRCRKVRSFLSAYCNGELDGRRKRAVSEHLLTCTGCRRDEAVYRNMAQSTAALPDLPLSEDFNVRLLERVAQERFAETRSKAYMPKATPLFLWRRVVPVVVTACLAVFAVVATIPTGDQVGSPGLASGPEQPNDAYLTAQPVHNPNMTVSLNREWSLSRQLARTERMNRISRSIAPAGTLEGWGGSPWQITTVSSDTRPLPYVTNFYRVRPVVRSFVSPRTTVKQEGAHAY